MASSFQLLLRGLDGRTSCLRFPSPTITGSLIQEQISATLRLPPDALLIFTGTSLVHHQTSLSADADGFFSSCSLSSRLRGGKGGFGSLLRGAATKAGQKKTSNFDACRDMSGRRLRHVNAEKKLKEWKAQAKERELEKAASEFLKKQVKRQEDDSGCYQLIEKFREQTSKAREDVESAVTSGLAEAKNFGKRKVVEDDLPSASSSKRAHTWCESTLDVIDDDDDLENATDESDDDHDGDTEKVFDIEVVKECLDSSEAVEVPEAKSHLKNRMVEGSKMAECNTSSENGKPQELIKCANIEDQIDIRNSEICSEEKRTENFVEEKLQEDLGYGELAVRAEKTVQTLESVDNDPSSPRDVNILCDGEQCNSEEVPKECKTINVPRATENHPMSVPKSVEQMQETFKLDHFSHASDLEILGLDRLKFELQMRGLKCGGSLSERAGRLFLLKTIQLENLDKKHFAKARG